MAVEQGNYISDLDVNLPAELDIFAEGDDHLRLIKRVLKNIFRGKNNTGFIEAVLPTITELNDLVGLSENVQARLDGFTGGNFPVGGIVAYEGLFSNLPPTWSVCDGTNGTPDLRDMFVLGAYSDIDSGTSGGSMDSIVLKHSHFLDHNHTGTVTNSPHRHIIPAFVPVDGPNGSLSYYWKAPIFLVSGAVVTSAAGGHSHGMAMQPNSEAVGPATDEETGVGRNAPPFIKLAYIQRIS